MLEHRTTIQLALGFIGVVVFGYGVRADEPRLRLIGLGFIAAAALLRFARRRSH